MTFFISDNAYLVNLMDNLTGYSQRMRLQRRLNRMYTVCSFILMITGPATTKLVSLFSKSSNKPLNDFIQGSIEAYLYLGIVIFKEFQVVFTV